MSLSRKTSVLIRNTSVFAFFAFCAWPFLLPATAGPSQPDPAPAQGPATLRIAVIDTEKVLTDSRAGRTAVQDLEKLRDKLTTEAEVRQGRVRDLRAKLDQSRASLSEADIRLREAEIEALLADMRRFQDDANREVNKQRDEMLKSIEQKVMPVINQYGREGGYSLIFRKFESGLIYADDAVDITADVLRRVDAQP